MLGALLWLFIWHFISCKLSPVFFCFTFYSLSLCGTPLLPRSLQFPVFRSNSCNLLPILKQFLQSPSLSEGTPAFFLSLHLFPFAIWLIRIDFKYIREFYTLNRPTAFRIYSSITCTLWYRVATLRVLLSNRPEQKKPRESHENIKVMWWFLLSCVFFLLFWLGSFPSHRRWRQLLPLSWCVSVCACLYELTDKKNQLASCVEW